MNQSSGGVQGGASAFSGLSDVAISSPSTGQVPVYNSGTSKWENGPIEDAGGATADQLTVVASLFSDALTDGLATKLPLAGGTMTGAINVATGASHQRKINNVLIEETKELGGAAGPPCRVLYDAAGGNAMTVTNSSGVIYQDLPTPDFRVRNAAASYARIGGWPLTPSDMPAGATQAGTSHAGDATYRNQYSLAAGSHYGFLFVTDELGSATIFTINGTTITLYANCGANVWSAGGATDRKARISAGAVQVQCGATFGAGYVSTFFLGTVI